MYLSEKILDSQWFDYHNLDTFRFSVLKTFLIVSFGFTYLIATLALTGRFPLPTYYIASLYVYGSVTLSLYFFRHKVPYRKIVHIAILGALILFFLILKEVKADELRMVWFFPTVLAAYILNGRLYGVLVSLLSVILVVYSYMHVDIGLSGYGLFTFLTALIVFNLFAHVFLKKIEFDESLLLKKVEEEVLKQREKEEMLLKRYRMAQMGEMIDAIAHQWRQPLMQHNLMLMEIKEELRASGISNAYITDTIDEMFELNRYMSRTIDDFRRFFAEDQTKEACNMRSCIEEIAKLMKKSLEGVSLQIDVDDTFECGCRNDLSQVLVIFLSNSLDAFKQQGTEKPAVFIKVESEGHMFVLHYEDNGGGVDEEMLPKIFDPYVTTKAQSDGTGLGLYIVKIITEAHLNGTVSACNGDDGLHLTIRFPQDA